MSLSPKLPESEVMQYRALLGPSWLGSAWPWLLTRCSIQSLPKSNHDDGVRLLQMMATDIYALNTPYMQVLT